MSIMLGNLSVSQIEKRIGLDFPQGVRNLMDFFGSIDIDESNNYLEFEK